MSFSESSRQQFAPQLDELADRLEMGIAVNHGAVGFVVVDADSHEVAIRDMQAVAHSVTGNEPELITHTSIDPLISKVQGILNRGRNEQPRLQTVSLIDLALIDYDHPDNQEAVGKLLFGMNMGRTLLARSALATVLTVPESHFSLFQELSDLYSTREFVLRLTKQIS